MATSEVSPPSLQPAFYKEFESCQNVLIAGCGGGYDIFQGLPLYAHLRSKGINTHLASFTFMSNHDEQLKMEKLSLPNFPTNFVWKVMPNTENSNRGYFPEAHLAQFLNDKGYGEVPVWMFDRVGCAALKEMYETLISHLGGVDCIIIIDGGTDSLMKGDECKVGSVEEDYTSMMAVNLIDGVEKKYLASVGLGVDRFHGVSDVSSLRAISELVESDACLGCQMLFKGNPCVDLYIEAVTWASKRSNTPSIVGSSIRDAMLGRFGNHHSNPRTKGSKLFINPLMTLLMVFDNAKVIARMVPEFRALENCTTISEVRRTVQQVRSNIDEGDDFGNELGHILDEENYPGTSDLR